MSLADDFGATDRKSDDAREGRYYGFLSGVVTNVSDPQSLGRIKARVHGQGDKEESDWLVPMWPGSMEAIPFKDDPVMVGFVDGDPNRGFWSWHPHSTTKNRPNEMMVLGSTLIGMMNNLVTQFNQLRSDYSTHVHLGASTTCVNGAAWTGSTNGPTGGTSATQAGKGKDPDGAVVANKSGDQTVLSKNLKVR